LSDVEIEIEI